MLRAGWTRDGKEVKQLQMWLWACLLGAMFVPAQAMTYREPRVLEVGGQGVVWAIPSTPTFFQSWASNNPVRGGDVLQFNKPVAGDIAEIYEGEINYYDCDTSASAYRRLLTNEGESKLYAKIYAETIIHYFKSVSPSNCTKGLQFALTQESVTIPDPPVQPPTTSTLQGRAAQVIEVGGPGRPWQVPSDKDFFVNWAKNRTFRIGDELRFNFLNADYKVSKVPEYKYYESCLAYIPTWNGTSTVYPYKFQTPGVHYFLASGPVEYCVQGMRFAAFVYCEDGTLACKAVIDGGEGGGGGGRIPLISGLSVTGIVLLALLGLCCWCLCCRKQSGGSSSPSPASGGRPTRTTTTTTTSTTKRSGGGYNKTPDFNFDRPMDAETRGDYFGRGREGD